MLDHRNIKSLSVIFYARKQHHVQYFVVPCKKYDKILQHFEHSHVANKKHMQQFPIWLQQKIVNYVVCTNKNQFIQHTCPTVDNTTQTRLQHWRNPFVSNGQK
jgi:hypothetical protein